ncbi:DUF1674 domain-containing protein [Roseibium denhamense]|uniref:DUF1674 domain-containing protein n=1 Tax=Roseibium denhamense TaxID=76305 RepID=A0ABY1PCS0_9HYPH|nr:DUF1674 domain-containing protein [Roseibium denhamense]MTI07513.1 DUF1674 domain-containing protein [Roseibium denhamense]SMP30117.1 hypothetical protein SAMN06265374_3209 [Roseibium denhamense]
MTDSKDVTTPHYTSAEAPSLKSDPAEVPKKNFEDLPPAAQRALKEAEARRKEIDDRHNSMEKEVDGRGGLEPTRYDDWEIKGLTVDF